MHISDLFRPRPGNCYLLVSSFEDELSFELSKMLQNVNAQLLIQPDVKKLLCAKPREFDVVILRDVYLDEPNQDELLRATYRSLANAGYIIIMQKSASLNLFELYEKLQQFEFRSPNNIELIDSCDLVMAKKMHMWGNGL